MNKTVNLFVLAGCWECPDDIGVTVVAISSDEKQLIDRLDQIADTQAKEYVSIEGSILMEEHTDTRYEISGGISGNARFYITEEPAVINEALMGEISRAMSESDRARDVENYLKELWECGNIEDWKYEYMANRKEVIREIVVKFEKYEDCNVSFNSTMDMVVEEAKNTIQLDDKVLEFLWQRLGDVPVDHDGCVEEDFMGHIAGTDREEIWSWFDENYSEGVKALMKGEKRNAGGKEQR